MINNINEIINRLQESSVVVNISGVGEQAVFLKELNKKCLCVVNQEIEAINLSNMLTSIGVSNALFCGFDVLFTSSKYKSKQNSLRLIQSLAEVMAGVDCVVATPEIYYNYISPIQELNKNLKILQISKSYSLQELEETLINSRYSKVPFVEVEGDFSIRGDILDIFVIGSKNPTRISFFDDEIEDIYSFDISTSNKIEVMKELRIIPNTALIFNKEEIHSLIEQLTLLNQKCKDSILQGVISNLEVGNSVPSEMLLCVKSSLKTIYSELRKDRQVVVFEKMAIDNFIERELTAVFKKINLIFENDNLKDLYKRKLKNIEDYSKIIFVENTVNFAHNIYPHFEIETLKFTNFLYRLELLKIELEPFIKEGRKVILCLKDEGTMQAISSIFLERNIGFSYDENKSGFILTTKNIPFNVCFKDFHTLYIGENNFAHKKEQKKIKNQDNTYIPKAGEYVVHSVHGIGKCEGVVNIKANGIFKDYFKIIYKNGDSLYVPIEDTRELNAYVSGEKEPALNKIGGKEFSAIKERVEKSLEDMSQELLELYSKRNASVGFKYSEDDYLYAEFENSFEFEETPDQMQAIIDVKNDMISGKVMDRLICGDVGFGKTEVAMRAIFKAVLDAKQVAVLAPTTILSMQHFNNLQERFKNFNLNIKVLNRFKTAKEQAEILKDVKAGKVQVLVGTHRLLSEDVSFFDLGLLVLDEEQRFGVKAKEKIKELKTNVDVLTLSATPIPRTLNMALMNIKDISIINTPPINRNPVKTYVMEYDIDILIDAIKLELERGGQVLIVENRIESLSSIKALVESRLKGIDVKVDIAHGQMEETQLARAIDRLYNNETNIFISTTLIENGVDLPRANTLIVLNSNHLGLSQMYQLRGRVGRNNLQAYAYFTYPKQALLTSEATERLQAIAENTELGSGFKLAMRDLQIRGAGELLGKQQHGHMLKVGYDLYIKMLEKTTKRLLGQEIKSIKPVKLNIALNASIPPDFVGDEAERLKIYSLITSINSTSKLQEVVSKLINLYGRLPQEILELCNMSLIKVLCEENFIKQVNLNNFIKNIVIYKDDWKDEEINKFLGVFNELKEVKNNGEITFEFKNQNMSIKDAESYVIRCLSSK